MTQEGEAAEECEGEFKSAPKETKQLASDKVQKLGDLFPFPDWSN